MIRPSSVDRDLIPLPYKTKENYKVFIYRLRNPDLDLFNFVDAVKTFFMLADTRLTGDEDIPAGEIPIFDSANVTLKFIGKINLSALRKYMLYTQVGRGSFFWFVLIGTLYQQAIMIKITKLIKQKTKPVIVVHQFLLTRFMRLQKAGLG